MTMVKCRSGGSVASWTNRFRRSHHKHLESHCQLLLSQILNLQAVRSRRPPSTLCSCFYESWSSRSTVAASPSRIWSRSFCSVASEERTKMSTTSSSSTATTTPTTTETTATVPIVIVGGGPTGLFMAYLLQLYKVPFCLLEAKTTQQRFEHPQAHFLNTRTMEILKHTTSMISATSNRLYEMNGDGGSAGLYHMIRQSMPPVEEWMSFRFGPTMSATDDGNLLMATVVHPVDVPLRASSDANGKLVTSETSDVTSNDTKGTHDESRFPLSDVAVGHLAQHTFCRILYDIVQYQKQENHHAKDQTEDQNDKILYGHAVNAASFDEVSRQWTIKTNEGISVQCSMIVAADGARSFIRTHVLNNAIRMLGKETIQNLMNVHFQIPSMKDDEKIPPAMLYTVFHSKVLAMVVRHGPGDYVMQIPYFAPYQTPDEDFSQQKVHEMVSSAIGDDSIDFVVRSIRPWTMGSLVADRYYSDTGVFLVGDAAHVFPPAGGFGMNTGLQDAFSLAWKLAAMVKQEKVHSRTLSSRDIDKVGQQYEQQRRPVAQRNAALSVRNYNRVLGVMQSCYLNHEHPTALIAALDASSSFVPMGIRRQTFRSLLQTALFPLSQLRTSPYSVFSRHVKANLRRLLQSGQGLPLLFPKHELDFTHEPHQEIDHCTDWSQDSVSSWPKLKTGSLFPHIPVRVSQTSFDRFPRLKTIDVPNQRGTDEAKSFESKRGIISTRDLPAQLATDEDPLTFCVVHIVRKPDKLDLAENDRAFHAVIQSMEKSWTDFKLPVVACRLMGDTSARMKSRSHGDILTMLATGTEFEHILRNNQIKSDLFIVINPDGHIRSILTETRG